MRLKSILDSLTNYTEIPKPTMILDFDLLPDVAFGDDNLNNVSQLALPPAIQLSI